jgi:5-methylcytosine-specific restriction endonuclease McrA
MKVCEKCRIDHKGDYGSGRFCSKVCARSFSTSAKRKEINRKVQLKATGRPSPLRGTTQAPEHIAKRRTTITSTESRERAKLKTQKLREDRYQNTAFDDLHLKQKKRRILEEQNGACNRCGVSTWMAQPLPMELEHKDGNSKNNLRSNLEVLCPNCHAQTPTWRKAKKPGKRKYTDEVIVETIVSSRSMNECLAKLELKWGSAQTIAKVMGEYNVRFKD